MSIKVDFHTHSYYSDGELSPTDLIKWAKENEISTIALTDHDVTEGVKEAKIAGDALDVTVVSGVELSSMDKEGNELHILGYYIDVDNIELRAACMKASAHRDERNKKYYKILEDEFSITKEDLLETAGRDFIGKSTIAKTMARKGVISRMEDAFSMSGFFHREDIEKIVKEKMTAKDAIDVIKAAGGIAVLAHPGRIKGIGKRDTEEFYENFDKLLRQLKKDGLKGLECIYSSHSDSERLRFIEFAEKYHLHITEGSDFHDREHYG